MTPDKRTVLLVEDNKKLCEINRRALEKKGYAVFTALTLGQARERLSSLDPDVILLDVVLPDGSGFDFCEDIRNATKAHILFLTSRREHEDKLRGMTLGGDDYITKPFKLEELLVRVAAAMRRRDMHETPAQTIKMGGLTLDVIAGQAFIDGTDILLTKKEFAMLLLLIQSKSGNMSAEYLYEKVWNQPMNNDKNAVKKQVSNLRKKLEGSGYTVTFERGGGYCFDRE